MVEKEKEITNVLGGYKDTFGIPFEIHTRKSKYEFYMMLMLNSIFNDGFFHLNSNNYKIMENEEKKEKSMIHGLFSAKNVYEFGICL